jgi:hypothetical protein
VRTAKEKNKHVVTYPGTEGSTDLGLSTISVNPPPLATVTTLTSSSNPLAFTLRVYVPSGNKCHRRPVEVEESLCEPKYCINIHTLRGITR